METWFTAFAVLLAISLAGWVVSLVIRNVSLVDSLWSLFFLVAAVIYAGSLESLGFRSALILALVAAWALRLSVYVTVRNWGEPEDRRYRKLREKHAPFAIKSLYIVFGLQALLAWIISLPLLPALTTSGPLTPVDFLAAGLWIVGFVFEAGGDLQMMRFKNRPENEGRVLDTGLWRYTRHPNYFGDFCIWWSFYLFALSAGAWWSIVSPLLMTFLLLKVSGVALSEKDISERRPAYADYVRRTNAFFPGRPAKSA